MKKIIFNEEFKDKFFAAKDIEEIKLLAEYSQKS